MRALAGRLRLDAALSDALHPHEETHAGHLERLQDFVAVTTPPPLLLLMRDSDPKLWNELRDCEREAPVWEGRRDDGLERLFVFRGRKLLDEVRQRLVDRGGMIADGHHRFRIFRLRRETAGEAPEMPVCLANLDDEPPVLLPGHLMLAFRKADQAAIQRRVEARLLDAYGPVPVRVPMSDPAAVAARLAELSSRRGILVARPGEDQLRGFVPRDHDDEHAPLARIAELLDLDTAARRHDLSRSEDLSASLVHGTERALAALTRTTADLVLCLPALPTDEIFAQALCGRLQPPKTTYFHPKPPGVLES